VEGVTVVRDIKGARRAIEALYAHKDNFFAVDTEVGKEGGREGGREGGTTPVPFSYGLISPVPPSLPPSLPSSFR
jgi:hypothetical protein